MRSGVVKIFYELDGFEIFKSLPYRADATKVIETIDAIKKEIGYESIKLARDDKVRKELKKPMMFANVGEENE